MHSAISLRLFLIHCVGSPWAFSSEIAQTVASHFSARALARFGRPSGIQPHPLNFVYLLFVLPINVESKDLYKHRGWRMEWDT